MIKTVLITGAANGKIRSNIQALARLFWFTVEFALMRENGHICVYGSGMLSPADEIKYAVTSKEVQLRPFQLEWVINQSFEYDRFQPLFFVVESFEHLFEEVNQREKWLLNGKLDNVSPGEPGVNENDLKIFLQHENIGVNSL